MMIDAHTGPLASHEPDEGHRGSASPSPGGRAVVAAWLVSVVLHAGGLTAMFVLVFPFVSREPADVPISHVEVVGPLASLSIPIPTPPDVSKNATAPDADESRLVPAPTGVLNELSLTKKPELSIIGIGTGGGDFSRYGLTAGGGRGPEFFGLGGSARGARRIVYVVDRSGSMLDTFDHVREELRRSIGKLRRSQKFHVVFFNAGKPLENPPKRLVSAIKARKQSFFKFMETVFPTGSTRPARAMRRALAVEPDLVYFLTDGAFDASLIDKLNDWNRDRRVKIYTIAFFDRTGAALLERIAREHNGEYKFVSENDLP